MYMCSHEVVACLTTIVFVKPVALVFQMLLSYTVYEI